ncbi:hypothetical protein [Leptospira sp. 'Mane']|uniref:hypothetical protein n=1 Tax=Leptospira sp. 'Mane' TaxID=3387407 RepID=UPI00398BB656
MANSDTKNNLLSWFYHPFWGTYLFFFALKNWDLIYPLLQFSGSLQLAYFQYAKGEISQLNSPSRVLYPAIASLSYIAFSPWVSDGLKLYKEKIKNYFYKKFENEDKKIFERKYKDLVSLKDYTSSKNVMITRLLDSTIGLIENDFSSHGQVTNRYRIIVSNKKFDLFSFVFYDKSHSSLYPTGGSLYHDSDAIHLQIIQELQINFEKRYAYLASNEGVIANYDFVENMKIIHDLATGAYCELHNTEISGKIILGKSHANGIALVNEPPVIIKDENDYDDDAFYRIRLNKLPIEDKIIFDLDIFI